MHELKTRLYADKFATFFRLVPRHHLFILAKEYGKAI